MFLCFSNYKNPPQAISPNFPLLPHIWIKIFPTVISQAPIILCRTLFHDL